jgi:hypothetical protein
MNRDLAAPAPSGQTTGHSTYASIEAVQGAGPAAGAGPARHGRLREDDRSAIVTEVARRAGHSIAVLLKIYAHCIDGRADAVNKRISDALSSGDDPDDQPQEDQAS